MGYELMQELELKNHQLDRSIKQLRVSGSDYAQKERDYKVLLRSECLKLRDSGMAIGMIQMTAYGIPEVAQKRFERDVAEATYKANMESINSLKLQLRLLDAQIQREWGASG